MRQYQGGSPLTGTITRTLTLLDSVGDSLFPGNVGIGTTTPRAPLHVKPSGGASDDFNLLISQFRPNIVLEDLSTSANDFQLFLDSDTLSFRFGDASTDTKLTNEVMTIGNSGNVGIGTTSPAGLLHLSSSSGDTKLIIEADSDNNNEDDNAFIIFRLDGGLETGAIWHGNATGSNDNSLNLACSTTVNGGIKFLTSDVNGYENAIERMQIDSSGNVGIGTTSPENALHVLRTGFDPNSNDNAALRVEGNWGGGIVFSEGADRTSIYSPSGSQLVFAVNGTSSGVTEAMRIRETGNVGIGTNSPSYKLEVNGSFAATTKSFVIDHPSKPNHKLRYGSLEGPENGVYVRGKSREKSFMLPDYWKDLVHEDSITVQLTPIGSGTIYVNSYDTEIISVGGTAKEYFYYVMAERKDVERFEVEYADVCLPYK